MCLLLFASRKNNKIKWDVDWLSRKLPIEEPVTDGHIKELISHGLLETYDNASDMLATCYRKTETEESRDREEKSIFTLQQVKDSSTLIGLSDGECEAFFNFYNSQGWLKGNGLQITNLPSQLANWKKNGYKFPDAPKPPDPKKTQEDQWDRQCGEWIIVTGKRQMSANAGFVDRLKDPQFRAWAEEQNSIVKEIA